MEINSQNQFVALVQANRGLIYHIINYYCRDENYRDDLYQDIMLSAYKSYGNFKGESKFNTWIGRIARNVAITRLRRLKTQIKIVAHNNVFYEIEDIVYAEKKFPVIDKLTDIEKRTLCLRMEGLTFAEISQKTGEPIGRLLVRMHRIKNELAEAVKDELS